MTEREIKIDMEPVAFIDSGDGWHEKGVYSADHLAALQAENEQRITELIFRHAARLDTLQAENERLKAQVKTLMDFIKYAQVSSGVCCCGDAMENHQCSDHSPVDVWDNAVTSLVEKYEGESDATHNDVS